MKFVQPSQPGQNSQQVSSHQAQPQQQQQQPVPSPSRLSHSYGASMNPPHSTSVNSHHGMNGPSSAMNNANHAPPGVSGATSGLPSGMSFSGTTASSHLHSSAEQSDGAMSDADASSSSAMVAAASSSALPPHLEAAPLVLTKKRLQDLVKEIDPMEVLDEDVEDVLLQIADDFIENVVTSGCMMAKHRKSSTLEVKDVQLHLQRNWNMWIPGFGGEELRPYKKAAVTDAHKQRLALIKKTLKKF